METPAPPVFWKGELAELARGFVGPSFRGPFWFLEDWSYQMNWSTQDEEVGTRPRCGHLPPRCLLTFEMVLV